jgi:hypothetical protein
MSGCTERSEGQERMPGRITMSVENIAKDGMR